MNPATETVEILLQAILEHARQGWGYRRDWRTIVLANGDFVITLGYDEVLRVPAGKEHQHSARFCFAHDLAVLLNRAANAAD